MTKTALVGLAEIAEAEHFDSSWWFEPFGLDPTTIADTILPTALRDAIIAVGIAVNRTMIPYPLAATEPDGIMLAWPGARSGLALLVADSDGGKELIEIWPFITDGEEHEIEIERVFLAPNRLQAMVEGTIARTLPLTWMDVLFPVDRGFYAEGSVHRVLLAGIAHRFSAETLPPIRIAPDAPSYAAFRAINPKAVDDDGAVTLNMQGMTAILPVGTAHPTLYSMRGPVKRVTKYTGDLFGRDFWDVRVTVARAGREDDRDIVLSIFVSDIALKGQALPNVGDDVSAVIRLQGRIWWPNVSQA